MADNDYTPYLEQLKSGDPQKRYEAICWFARYRVCDEWHDIYEVVWERTEDLDKRVSWAAGIAGSMIAARNDQSGMMFGSYVPDFLVTWDELNGGVEKHPTEEDWGIIRRMAKRLGFE